MAVHTGNPITPSPEPDVAEGLPPPSLLTEGEQPGASGAMYKHLIECIGDGFLALDAAGTILYANASATRILGQTHGQLLGSSLFQVFPQLRRKDLEAARHPEAAETRPQPMRIPIFMGHQFHQFEFGFHPFEGGIGLLFRDVSEQVRQEIEIAKLNATMAVSQQLLRSKNDELNASLETLARLNEELANADKLKSEFLANCSHELRTPLNSIIGFLQLILEGLCENREEETEYTSNALTSAQHLLSLINDILDITKIEAGKMTLLIDDIDLDNIFHEVSGLTHIQAQQKNLQLTFEIRDERYRIARADFHKVKQVLINLVGNAIKFTTQGGIQVWAESESTNSEMLRICVRDTGIGVMPHLQRAIFEKFTQVDGTSTRKYQGTGLGLAISKNLVELMGGHIEIFSEGDRKGTTMSFTLPLGNRARQGSDLDSETALPTTF